MSRTVSSRLGFTLIEPLAVITILAVLLLPAPGKAGAYAAFGLNFDLSCELSNPN